MITRCRPALALALALALTSCRSGDAPARRASVPAAPGAPDQATSPGPAAGNSAAFFPAAELARIAGGLGHAATGRTLQATPTYSVIQGRRTVSGEPEVHDHWADIAYVQAGRATLITGGRVQGGHDASPGELRGGTIAGGTARPIAAGDLYLIPAAVPHQYRLAPGESLTYLTIKAPAPR